MQRGCFGLSVRCSKALFAYHREISTVLETSSLSGTPQLLFIQTLLLLPTQSDRETGQAQRGLWLQHCLSWYQLNGAGCYCYGS